MVHSCAVLVSHAVLLPRSWAFALPTVLLLQIPQAIVESFAFGSIVYWVAGMAPEAGRYFFFVLVRALCLTQQCPSQSDSSTRCSCAGSWGLGFTFCCVSSVFEAASQDLQDRSSDATQASKIRMKHLRGRGFFRPQMLFLFHLMATAIFRMVGAGMRPMTSANAGA